MASSSFIPHPPERPRFVSAIELRRLFNDGPYQAMIADGRLSPEFLRDAHLRAPDDKGHPACTRRQTIRYRDGDGNPVVLVFQYRLADGRLGGSGRPDPKRMWIEGEVLLAERERGQR